MPDILFYSPLTVGKIRFGLNEIWGHFEAILGVGLPNSRCEFYGQLLFGPSRLSVSIQDVIKEWNNHDIFGEEDDVPRLPSSTNAANLNSKSSIPSSMPSPTPQEWTEEDQEEFLRSITGIFDVTSEAIEGG